jgi:hypothetical protein
VKSELDFALVAAANGKVCDKSEKGREGKKGKDRERKNEGLCVWGERDA